jgi:hypothetical protein
MARKNFKIFLIFIIGLFAIMYLFKQQSSSKFGATTSKVTVSDGLDKYSLALKDITASQTVFATVDIPLTGITKNTSGDAYTITIESYNAGTLSYTINGSSSKSISNVIAPPTSTSVATATNITQCISQVELSKYGYTDAQKLGSTMCASAGKNTTNPLFKGTCGVGGNLYICNGDTGTISIVVPSFPTGTTVNYKSYDYVGNEISPYAFTSMPLGATKTVQANSLGYIAISVNTSTKTNYYYKASNYIGTDPTPPVTWTSNSLTMGMTITVPSVTISITNNATGTIAI